MCQFSIVCLDAVATTHNFAVFTYCVCDGMSWVLTDTRMDVPRDQFTARTLQMDSERSSSARKLGPTSGNGMGLGRDRAVISTAYRKFFRAWQGHHLKGVPAAGNVEGGMTSTYCLDIAEPTIAMYLVALGRGGYT